MARRRRRNSSPFLVGDGGRRRSTSVAVDFGVRLRNRTSEGLNGGTRGWGSEGEARWRSRSSVLTALAKKSGGNGGDGELDSEQPDGGEVWFWGGYGGGLEGYK